jgi:ABC-2 type transport system permease protein
MRKTLIVAQSEFLTLVRSKAFIISVVLMPVVMGGSILLVRATKESTDVRDRTFAYVDYSGSIGPAFKAAADAWNASSPGGDARTSPRFLPNEITPGGRSVDEIRLDLSDRVRREELFAFVEFPAGILDPDIDAEIRYYSDHPSYETLPQWIHATANHLVLTHRFRSAAIDKAVIDRLTREAPVDRLGLFERDERGGVKAAEQVDPVRAFVLPGVLLGLMYITVMSSAPQLLNSVIEEKMSRISEVLVASVTPFELMMGKLIGSAAVSVLLAMIYMAGGLVVAQQYGVVSAITPSLVLWFTLFLLLAVFIFGSIFVAIGAACTDLKDSQNMMTPVMLLVMLPMLTWAAVLRAPDGAMAVGLSLVPTAAPFLMMLRIALQPGPPAWQIALAVALMAGTVVLFVWAAGKIFRTGLLMQGKSATIPDMIRWVRAK